MCLQYNRKCSCYDVLIVLLIIIGVLSYVYLTHKHSVPSQNHPSPLKDEQEEAHAVPAIHDEVSHVEETLQQPRTRSCRTFDAEIARRRPTTEHMTDAVSDVPVIISTDEDGSESSEDDRVTSSRLPSPGARIQLSPLLQQWQQTSTGDSIPPIIEFPPESGAVVPVMRKRHNTGDRELVVRPRGDVARVDGMYTNQDEMRRYFIVIGQDMPADWYQLALSLGVPFGQIKAVSDTHPRNCWMCCQCILDMWRKNKGRLATKDDLIKAVEETNNNDVAMKLRDM
ncbi:PREDICTED: uncharacterized protein LOC109476224 [Branchiostoma belcheri]|uniref:Uncharacterized protein LOC109476224 n=1 Tax=Branchiostoma belcheri TaxID=7741 RepID=A0A6P4ZSS7_BRABE|nr:PREDICTED: uncharacterized protein LOC109476224 [Branchiostoma belcheri]